MGRRCADQLPRRPCRPHRQRAVDPLRLADHHYSFVPGLGAGGRSVRLHRDAALHHRARTLRNCRLHRAGQFLNRTSGILAVATPQHRGATIGLYSCIGFGAAFLGALLFGVTLDQFGGISPGSAPAIRFSGMSGYPPTRPADPRLAIRNIAYTAIPPPAGV
jgi:hypothetical protein